MPEAGYTPPQRLFMDGGECRVRFFSELDGDVIDYDFTSFAVARPLQEAFARAFDAHVGPGGQINGTGGANNAFRQLNAFVKLLIKDERPPAAPADLAPRHLKEFLLSKGDAPTAGMMLGLLRSLLVHVEGLTPQFAAKCSEWVPDRREKIASRGSYSPDEEKVILDAARKTVRAAAARIRKARELLERWRRGEITQEADPDLYEYGSILDMVERGFELPRNKWDNGTAPWIARHGTVMELMKQLHLNVQEACAITILLVRLTGENGSTIIKAPAAFHRTDGGVGPVSTVQVDLSKPRRGRRRYMTAALSDLPSWAAAPKEEGVLSARDELHTAFGLYTLALELTAPARRNMGSDRLLVYWVPKAGGRQPRQGTVVKRRHKNGAGFRDQLSSNAVGEWGVGLNLIADEPDEDGRPQRLVVGAGRMRVTHAAREQKPVAHTTQTLADTYLRRDRTSLREYQKVVADVLEKEVVKARTAGRIQQLSREDVAEALQDPETVAKRFGVSTEMLRLLLARDADTVLAACTDNNNSPHSPAGEPCRASFLKCLDCPCARAMPHHLAVQTVALDMIDERRKHMTAVRWAERFALPYFQLDDLLKRAGTRAVSKARVQAGDAERELVRRLLDGELDER
ncbi:MULTISPECIES: hypothetical protein [unclassified Streptomyces]|uniref:hypothetical protein n=1 Tax=unclassified Streptomyces TaxID=2593676 RepID=UPI00081B0E86|nr:MULTISPECIES: hypothetical protein [unclassified Streptomyces]MYQ55648.1 hypothetical protein [Streptomyces sp. SID4941]SCE40587.1 hypothetical protein GA0115247_14063 [Streptomyces sp. PalvLS-984]SDC85488.1 hypothetical protein F558DRAFT_02758 [Streptomyces sp. AmelKG-A3]